jgi:hypothetical protein
MTWLLLLALGTQQCFREDIVRTCCPTACSVKKSHKWYTADDVLRGCMVGMPCPTKGADTFTVCGC